MAAILDGLAWLGLHPDEPPAYQFQRRERHAEVAWAMLEAGAAYRCFAGPGELQAMREAAAARGERFRYNGLWRDRDPAEAPEGAPFAIRLKAPQEGETVIRDLVQGEVRVANAELDDMVLLRADGTPTYMLSVVVDDHDMGVTHVIRGDDHLNNAFRQAQVFEAMGWPLPAFAHIPLIHGPDGAKLSKRHGALGVDAYREMGLLPEAVRNYLLRLGWSHGDAEIVSTEEAVAWFGLEAVGRSPARFDREKLESVNAHYLRAADRDRLLGLLEPFLAAEPDEAGRARLRAGLGGLLPRAKTLIELAEAGAFYMAARPLKPDAKAGRLLADEASPGIAGALCGGAGGCGLDGRGAGGRDTGLRGGRRAGSGAGRPARARRAYRTDRISGAVRDAGGARPRRDAGPPPRRGSLIANLSAPPYGGRRIERG